ncbi:similar to Saccharomyces cerevisiae YBR162C TOS1 Covalently-bound cell wall protein of unknown function [Maudiozyma barnettii]|uniref:glucan endo-1,3-beta-D-glucosidase n=1 Tax=Maudiozyma barnettii TaxID=61262 RepID=A0A8H2ZHR4_9SACH|nr:Tos1p [Kazachstania barnettii]CAB4255068.1 similar to Saccharomyces cerevisiae YBR162C TOS1 Covalently-bound cell wall protein of unknown function [Kazachstania barnettii]CAD1783339.1 similar to Saccharomyces cerevisiae YBR162C TOS1 Covalently-bound cell wall protein of unknown function [Kazachstania barnettii]
MKFSKRTSLLSALTVLTSLSATASADCSLSSDGNYYCAQTDAVIYSNVGFSGSYLDVTNMDESSCACTQGSSTSFSGSLAPLDDEVSIHFRGPLNLKQFGVYYPSSSSSSLKKRDVEEPCEEVVSTKIQHKHRRDVAVEYVEITSTVWVDSNGNPVTGDATASATSYTQVNTVVNQATGTAAAATTKGTTATSAGASSASTSVGSVSSGDWVRGSYFTPGSTTNCTFMNHMGGSAGSGVWSSCFGNSISYAAADGISGASSAYALDDITLKSGEEYMIFSGAECSGNDCGYYRENIPAYHGFSGKDKIFVFEFQMPSDTDGSGYNQDMPAIWLLNAKIPRTLQYGNADCSCWESGCGEMDLFEILSAGSDKLISHVHDGQGGGSQDYFQRPVSSTLKAAVIFHGEDQTIHVVEVNDDFGSTLSSSTVSGWLNQAGSAAALP